MASSNYVCHVFPGNTLAKKMQVIDVLLDAKRLLKGNIEGKSLFSSGSDKYSLAF